MAEEAAERARSGRLTKPPRRGKAQRNGELGGQAWAARGGPHGREWHRRLRRVRGRAGRRDCSGVLETRRRDGEVGRGCGEGVREKGGRRRGRGEGKAEGGPLRRRLGAARGKRRAGAAARRAAEAVANGPGEPRTQEEKGGGSRRTRMAGPRRPPPPRGQGRLNRWGAGLQPLQLDFPADRRHFAKDSPPSFLPPSSSPLTLLPVVTCIRFTWTKVPLLSHKGVGIRKWGVSRTRLQLCACAGAGAWAKQATLNCMG